MMNYDLKLATVVQIRHFFAQHPLVTWTLPPFALVDPRAEEGLKICW